MTRETMTNARRPAFLRLVHSAEPSADRLSTSSLIESRSQGIFFPSSGPQSLIFLEWGKATAEELLDVLEMVQPKIVFDFRMAPRFDIGQLNRKRFFGILQRHGGQYVDFLGRIGIRSASDALLNPVLLAPQVSEFMAKLPVPHSGPFVFLHDEEFFSDRYVREFVGAIPSKTQPWEIYRPVAYSESSAKASSAENARPSAHHAAATPLARNVIFISHATPEDNAFVTWLTTKLSLAGYEVWTDISELSGGDGFWARIEDVIRRRAAKVLFVYSESAKGKAGTRKEVYLALKVGERMGLTRFVIPLRIDGSAFDETFIELVDIQAIDCRRDWLGGLKGLLSVLDRDAVPRARNARAEQFSALVYKWDKPSFALVNSSEELSSNWLAVTSLPNDVGFFSCQGVTSNQLPAIASQLAVPCVAYYTHLATTATKEHLEEALAAVGLGRVNVNIRASVSWTDFFAGRWSDLPTPQRGEARRFVTSLMNRAWMQFVIAQGASVGELSSGHSFVFFRDNQLPKNEVRFIGASGKTIRRQLVGFSNKRKVHWHFGVQSRCGFLSGTPHYSLTPHVTFSFDGRTPLHSKAQLHLLRRSFCRSWWNNRWRDLLQAFIAALAGNNNVLKLWMGSSLPVEVSTEFEKFICPMTIASAARSESDEQDLIEDQWDESVADWSETGLTVASEIDDQTRE